VIEIKNDVIDRLDNDFGRFVIGGFLSYPASDEPDSHWDVVVFGNNELQIHTALNPIRRVLPEFLFLLLTEAAPTNKLILSGKEGAPRCHNDILRSARVIHGLMFQWWLNSFLVFVYQSSCPSLTGVGFLTCRSTASLAKLGYFVCNSMDKASDHYGSATGVQIVRRSVSLLLNKLASAGHTDHLLELWNLIAKEKS